MPFNPKTGGHAPNDLRDAFLSLIEDHYKLGSLPDQEVDGEPISAHDLCGRLWNCSDVLPSAEASLFDPPLVATYAQAARRLRELIPVSLCGRGRWLS